MCAQDSGLSNSWEPLDCLIHICIYVSKIHKTLVRCVASKIQKGQKIKGILGNPRKVW